jgi:LmbE family N-acetylglucosaminyl deacetylase
MPDGDAGEEGRGTKALAAADGQGTRGGAAAVPRDIRREQHVWLDYYDGACDAVDQEEARLKIEAVIREVQPDSVFTFGPDGMTGHADP